MKLKILKFKLLALLMFFNSIVYGQAMEFKYKNELTGVKDQWHNIILPSEIFEKIRPDYTDIRIFGVTESKKIVEAPYILKVLTEKFSQTDVKFNLINQSKNEKGFFYTFEMPIVNAINQIKLDFNSLNFDWKLSLEGSQDQQEWFTILEDYRILSIKNELTDFKFTKIRFNDSKFRFIRLFIASKSDPEFLSAKITLDNMAEGNVKNYPIKDFKSIENIKTKQTIVTFDLKASVPVYKLRLKVKDNYDYFRPITIQYQSGSYKTPQGVDYSYTTLNSSILNSFEKSEFRFNHTVMRRFKIIIDDYDNKPLNIESIEAEGYVFELVARFTEPANYFISYGNEKVGMPNYDIAHFADKIPKNITALNFGNEMIVPKEVLPIPASPIFNQNSIWLIMILVIVILGWFSFKMIREK